ncbi:hypothetical protein U1Q18_031296 [Sarracenia purpurea var. burkii]
MDYVALDLDELGIDEGTVRGGETADLGKEVSGGATSDPEGASPFEGKGPVEVISSGEEETSQKVNQKETQGVNNVNEALSLVGSNFVPVLEGDYEVAGKIPVGPHSASEKEGKLELVPPAVAEKERASPLPTLGRRHPSPVLH